jgi:hypothetical protein
MNEELQPTNEELRPLNDELRQRSDDLQSANGAMNRRGRPVPCRVSCARLAGDDDVRGAVSRHWHGRRRVIGGEDES